MSKVLECNVWCVADDKAESMGMNGGDSWMPFAVDLKTIYAVKLCGPNEFLGDDKATIHFCGNHVTVDVTFTDMLRMWKEALHE